MMWISVLIIEAMIAFFSLFFLHMNGFLSLLAIAVSAGTLVLWFLILRKLPRALQYLVLIFASFAGVFLLIRTDAVSAKDSLTDYREEIVRLDEQMMNAVGDQKKMDQIKKELEALEEEYGKTDSTLGIHALYCMMTGARDEAYGYLGSFSDRSSILYYTRLEQYYRTDAERDRLNDLYYMYDMMVQDHPEWDYAQRMAGVTQFEKKNYKGADYFLTAALELNENDFVSLYYLGASAYEQGNFEESRACFAEAVEKGATGELLSWIAWYEERMGEK